MKIPVSDLIVNPSGSIYHLDLLPEEISDIIITGGDPDRVKKISKFFDKIEVKKQKREFITHTGFYKGRRITALSTGIGTDNIDIVMNELDALVNIDLNRYEIKRPLKTLIVIRVGTAGSLQEDVPVDSHVFSTHGLGMDGLMNFYQHRQTAEEKSIQNAFDQSYQSQSLQARPYIVACSDQLQNTIGTGMIQGITATCCGFYGPQGRVLRYKLNKPAIVKIMNTFRFRKHRIVNFEMETSALYGLSRMLGHQACTVTTIVANRIAQTVSHKAEKSMNELIELVLDRVITL